MGHFVSGESFLQRVAHMFSIIILTEKTMMIYFQFSVRGRNIFIQKYLTLFKEFVTRLPGRETGPQHHGSSTIITNRLLVGINHIISFIIYDKFLFMSSISVCGAINKQSYPYISLKINK